MIPKLGINLRYKRYSYADYLSFEDEESWELIDGYLYLMSPAPSTKYQRISTSLIGEFYIRLKNSKCELFHAPFDVRFPRMENDKDGEIFDVVQPDISIICDPSKIDERGCKGAPTLIIEILSSSTAEKDLSVKRSLYEKSGVLEYWIVNPMDLSVMVFVLENEKYRPPIFYCNGSKIVSNAIGLEVDYLVSRDF